MAYTESSKKATIKYVKRNYDRLEIKIPKGRKAAVEAHAQQKGESVNGLVNGLLREDMGMTEEEWKEKADSDN